MSIITLGTETIANHFICAIVNDDYSGLSERDIDELEAWLRSINEEHGCSVYISTDSRSDTSGFTVDAISGLMAVCETVILYN